MRSAAKTDRGLTREVNEDNYALIRNERGDLLAAVCDGIGGSKAGEVASQIAVQALQEAFSQAPVFHRDYEVREFIQTALNEANDRIYNQSLFNLALKGMGTTCVGALVCQLGTYIFNVGDSRLYAHYSDGLIQMSEDHSVTGKLVREGKVSQTQALFHPQKNKLTNALGVWKVFRIDVNKIQPDYYQILLCSDGLSGYVRKQDIERVLFTDDSPAQKCENLINRAIMAGGQDNCTVIILENDERSLSV